MYVLNNKDNVHLRGFYPNDIPGVFSFSNSNFITFRTEQEANKTLSYILSEVNKEDNKLRWGGWANTHKRIANQLTISEA